MKKIVLKYDIDQEVYFLDGDNKTVIKGVIKAFNIYKGFPDNSLLDVYAQITPLATENNIYYLKEEKLLFATEKGALKTIKNR